MKEVIHYFIKLLLMFTFFTLAIYSYGKSDVGTAICLFLVFAMLVNIWEDNTGSSKPKIQDDDMRQFHEMD